MVNFRDNKFIKDIVIAGDDGKIYYLKEADWRSYEVPLTSLKPGLLNLLKHNVALAAVPEPEDAPTTQALTTDGKPGPLGFCYLVNLASLRTKTVFTERIAAMEDVAYQTWLADAKAT